MSRSASSFCSPLRPRIQLRLQGSRRNPRPHTLLEARFTRLYPIYILSLILSWRMIPVEYQAHSHGMFFAGMCSRRCFFRAGSRRLPPSSTRPPGPCPPKPHTTSGSLVRPLEATTRLSTHLAKMAGVWCLGLIPARLLPAQSRSSRHHRSLELWALAPDAQIHAAAPRCQLRLRCYACERGRGCAPRRLAAVCPWIWRIRRTFGILVLVPRPYAVIHDGLLMPLFGCMILGLPAKTYWPMPSHGSRLSSSARPATASTCSTSTCGT